MKYHKNFILGAPIRERDRQAFEKAILERFNGDAREASLFMGHEADRQITKAGGILSCTSILAGISYFVHAKVPLLLALIALLLSIGSFYAKWTSNVESVTDFKLDFEQVLHICYNRCVFNNISVFLVFASVIFLAPALLF